MIIIADRINSISPRIRGAIENRDRDYISDLAAFLEDRGSDYIDVNVSTCRGSEEENMLWALETVRSRVSKPLSIDSSEPGVIHSALEQLDEKGLIINSISGDRRTIEELVPIAVERECLIIALAMDEKGIPDSPEKRVEICLRIADEALSLGLKTEGIMFDPLLKPVSVDAKAGQVALSTLKLLKSELRGAKTVVGLSNISYGLPSRQLVNASFLSMALYVGLDAALLDPGEDAVMSLLKATEAALGLDPYCREYISYYRKFLKPQK